MVNFSVYLNAEDRKYINMWSPVNKSLSKYTLEHLNPLKILTQNYVCIL